MGSKASHTYPNSSFPRLTNSSIWDSMSEMKIGKNFYVKPAGIPERISAGGVVIQKRRGRYYLALVREGDLSAYLLPKGGVEAGKSLEDAARREILEEAGFKDLELVTYLGERQRLNYQRSRWVTTHYFLFKTSARQGRPTDKDHAYRSEWFPLDQLPEMLWPDQRELVEGLKDHLPE